MPHFCIFICWARNDFIIVIPKLTVSKTFANSFIEDAYEMYTSPKTFYARVEKEKSIKFFAKQIREKPLLLKKTTILSKELQIPLDSAIWMDAKELAGLK